MRDIKFRAWYKENEVMVYFPDKNASSFCLEVCAIEEGLVTQYTGLTDKNGKEIYEGDIVEPNQEYKKEMLRKMDVVLKEKDNPKYHGNNNVFTGGTTGMFKNYYLDRLEKEIARKKKHIKRSMKPREVKLEIYYDYEGYRNAEHYGYTVGRDTLADVHDKWEVIGNIYENPDLIKN